MSYNKRCIEFIIRVVKCGCTMDRMGENIEMLVSFVKDASLQNCKKGKFDG